MDSASQSPFKTNWNKYEDAMNNVVRKEVCRVFLWLYQGGSKYVGDYLDETPWGRKGLYKDQKAKLDRKEPPIRMDITLLYTLIQRTCGLPEKSDPVWTNATGSNCSSLEHTLYLIKEERNSLGHEGYTREAQEMSDDVLDKKLDYLRHLCAGLLSESARRCGRLNEIVTLTDKMDTQLQGIRGVTSNKFIAMAKGEKLKKTCTKMVDEWYQQPLLRRQGQPVTLDELLQWRARGDKASTFLLVTGEAGVGKSSLCRYLEERWLRPRSDGKNPLQRYHLVLLVRCGGVTTSDVVNLLQELLPETASWCSRSTLTEFLRTVPILWIFDGLEEATTDATQLMDSLLHKHQENIDVLVTSRPENGQDFSRRYSRDMTHIINVSLCGVDPFKAIQNMARSRKCDKDTARHAKSLMDDFKKLDKSIQQELQNPLKLRLTLQGWEDIRTSPLQVFDLTRLYPKITDSQIESLSESLSKGRMTKTEATRKVRKWLSFLCESAFSLVSRRKVSDDIIRKEIFSKLGDKCDDLGIPSSQCLSTFLSCSDTMFSSETSGYTFYHDTQVHFLAALHVDSVMKESNDLYSDTLRLFNISSLQEHVSEQPPLGHFLSVFLFFVSLASGSASDEVLKMMIKLLLNAIPLGFLAYIWFEVAIKASYEDRIMREIGRVMPIFWAIFDHTVEAARRLLEYSQPDEVILYVFRNPEEVKELEPLVRRLASLPVVMSFRLRHYTVDLLGKDTADKYLELICCNESPCVLTWFEGHLSDEGYNLLRHPKISDCCELLKLKVKSIESLEILCETVRNLESLKRIEVVVAMKQVPFTSAKLQARNITLFLPWMTEETAVATAKLTARLCQSYDELFVYDMTCSGIESFLLYIRKKRVRVNKFLGCYEDGENGPLSLGFGPLPLQYSMEYFRQHWPFFRGMACKKVTEDEAPNTVFVQTTLNLGANPPLALEPWKIMKPNPKAGKRF